MKTNLINLSINIIRQICIFIQPFLPFTSNKLQKMLNIKEKLFWKDLEDNFKPNHILNKPILLFRIIEDKEIEDQIKQLKNNQL